MSKTHDWGDKIIITLSSDGERRHKCWCKHYRGEDKYCKAHMCKCTGSAFCSEYASEVEEERPIFIYNEEQVDDVKQDEIIRNIPPKRCSRYDEYYRRAGYGDRLLHRTILFKSTMNTFKIGVVTDESLNEFAVEYNGKKVRYDKRAAFRAGGVYIFTEVEVTEGEK